MAVDVAGSIQATLDRPGDEHAIEFDSRWMTWSEVRRICENISGALQSAAIAPLHSVAFVARNTGVHAAVLAGLIAEQRPISMIYAFQSSEALAADIDHLRPVVVIAGNSDWSVPMEKAARRVGALVILIDSSAPYPIVVREMACTQSNNFRLLPEAGVEILSSGTTGAPKRIFHRSEVLFRSVSANLAETMEDDGPHLVSWPIGGIGGLLQLARAFIVGAPITVLEKFSVWEAVDLVKRHKLGTLAVTPTMLRMILDAEVPREELASLSLIYGGSGPLDIDLQDKVEDRFGIPVIWALGATEFCGTIISWSLELKREYGRAKRGSTGRALPDCELRVCDPADGRKLGPGEVGRLEVRVASIGSDWIETTDLAAIDNDGFVFHHGRSDGAIVRGGFKVIPEKVNEVLRLHPAVAEAAVVGMPDERLGEVPVAAIVLRPGMNGIGGAELRDHARQYLVSPQVPTRFYFFDEMPYTASTKVNIAALRAMVAHQERG